MLPTRGRTHWRRGDDYMNDAIFLVKGGKGISFAQSCLLDDAPLLELQAGIERWETHVARYEKLKGKMDDEIKRAGLESLVREELENHLIFQLQPFEDFRGVRARRS